MNLAELANATTALPLSALSSDRQLASDIQDALIIFGILDRPVDGKFGPVSNWALREFCAHQKIDIKDGLTKTLARALLDANALSLRVKAGPDLAGRIAACMMRLNHWINRHPDCLNIVYVEGMNVDGTPNDNKPNRFNDCRGLLSIDNKGKPVLRGIWKGTTEPGKYWTENPMNPKGAARIAFGQYKSWSVGRYNGHDALLQVDDVVVYRDLNKDYDRVGDRTDKGLFGIHHHWGYNYPDDDLSNSSAGCLVGQKTAEHKTFMKMLAQDPRYIGNNAYRFVATIVPYGDLPAP